MQNFTILFMSSTVYLGSHTQNFKHRASVQRKRFAKGHYFQPPILQKEVHIRCADGDKDSICSHARGVFSPHRCRCPQATRRLRFRELEKETTFKRTSIITGLVVGVSIHKQTSSLAPCYP